MEKKREPVKTSKKDIIKYWMDSPKYANGDEVGMAIDRADLDVDGGRCWRCGTTKNIQRCHIVPDSQGGKDEPSNLLLLCKSCHNDAPNVSNATAEDFFDWMRNSRQALVRYLNENDAGSWGMLSFYPPKGERGQFWDLKVLEIGLRDFNFNIAKERSKLSCQFVDLVMGKDFCNSDIPLGEKVEIFLPLGKGFDTIMYLIDEQTKVTTHFKQGKGNSEANLQTEALANIKNIKYIKSLMEETKDNFISHLNDILNNILDEEGIELLNEELEYELFSKKELTTSID